MSAPNLLVFREGRRNASGRELLLNLREQLARFGAEPTQEQLLRALLLAGELECGVADAGSDCAEWIEAVTDRLAEAACRRHHKIFIDNYFSAGLRKLLAALPDQSIPENLPLSPPEGFAYYALHPLAYAERFNEIAGPVNDVMVIGIRSIGTTLSAVTTAAARIRGIQAQRITVRPKGHPYNRVTEFSPRQQEFIQSAVTHGAIFLIVDEGPGLSGSSFLSVAEALETGGVPREKIVLLCGHEPNPDALCAQDAAQRWRRFRSFAVGEPRRPAEAGIFIGGGEWRKNLLPNELEWPAAWTSFERLKYLSEDSGKPARLYKFVGLGHYGDQVFEREQKVAEAGFGPLPQQESDGFVSYPWIDGSPMSPADLSLNVITRLAEYCGYRARAFAVRGVDIAPLQHMAEHNLDELKIDSLVTLKLKHPVIADGHMQPHEWILTKDGEMLKTDSGSHGDDHFFPGATDIAWDLAGAVVEWCMTEQHAEEFLVRYHHASGDDARCRIGDFIRAYAIFRSAYCLMAANAMRGSDEQARLEKVSNEYDASLKRTKAAMVSTVLS